MTRNGKHGKPSSRLPTLPTPLGNPGGIPTFPQFRRRDQYSKTSTKAADELELPQGACNECLRSTAQRMSRYTHPLARFGFLMRAPQRTGRRISHPDHAASILHCPADPSGMCSVFNRHADADPTGRQLGQIAGHSLSLAHARLLLWSRTKRTSDSYGHPSRGPPTRLPLLPQPPSSFSSLPSCRPPCEVNSHFSLLPEAGQHSHPIEFGGRC